MRTQHTAHTIESFPINCAAFLSPTELVLGGGGGNSRSGVKNRLQLYRVEDDKSLALVNELLLAQNEDAPVSVAAHPETRTLVAGINGTTEQIEKGASENCRVFTAADNQLAAGPTRATLANGDPEDYQRVTVISPGGDLVAVAGMRDLSLLAFPSLQPAATPIHITQGEIYDATFSATQLVVATTVNLLVYALTTTASEKGKEKASAAAAEPITASLALVRTVERAALPGSFAGSSFRAARFDPADPRTLYTLVNTVPSAAQRRTRGTPRPAFVLKWDAEKWEVVKVRKVSDKSATCFETSADGKLLAFAAADMSVGVINAKNLAPLLSILKVHDLPSTCLKFNPTSTMLVSASVDNTVRVVMVPDNITGASWQTLIGIVVAILVALLALAAQSMYGQGGLHW